MSKLSVFVIAALLAIGAVVGGRYATAGRATAKACPAGYVSEADAREASSLCVTTKHPEKLQELILRQEGLETVRSAPYDQVATGAYANAVDQHQQNLRSSTRVPGTGGAWSQYGHGPLIVNDAKYNSVNGLGLVYNEGRLDDLKYDAANNRLFAAKGTGGVWMSPIERQWSPRSVLFQSWRMPA